MAQPRFASLTITNGQTTSPAYGLGELTLVGFALPATFDGTALTFLVSADNVTYYELDDTGTGAAVPATVAASKAYSVDPILFLPWNYVKFVAGTAQATTDTVIVLIVRPIS